MSALLAGDPNNSILQPDAGKGPFEAQGFDSIEHSSSGGDEEKQPAEHVFMYLQAQLSASSYVCQIFHMLLPSWRLLLIIIIYPLLLLLDIINCALLFTAPEDSQGVIPLAPKQGIFYGVKH